MYDVNAPLLLLGRGEHQRPPAALIRISCSVDLEAGDWSVKAALTEGNRFGRCRN